MDLESDLVVEIDFGKLHDYFGGGANEVMHRRRDIRRDVLTAGEPS